jgi:hypothetical protein
MLSTDVPSEEKLKEPDGGEQVQFREEQRSLPTAEQCGTSVPLAGFASDTMLLNRLALPVGEAKNC